MRLGSVILLALGLVCLALPADATLVTSAFNNFAYSYSVTPSPGETIMDFHVYAGVAEIGHPWLNVVMPAGWQFTVQSYNGKTVITWWTTTNPLPVGVATAFGYTHYCAPCCHSWFTTASGTPDPGVAEVDASWNHPDWPCNIPAEFSTGCPATLGGVVAPIYPQATPAEPSAWGHIKALYR